MKNSDEYKIGVDLSTTGAIAVTCGDKVIDVLKYPKLLYDKSIEKEIDKELKAIGLTKTKEKNLKAKKKSLKRRGTRDYIEIHDFIKKYVSNVSSVVIEEPIRQMGGMATSADTIASNFTTYGVYTSIFSILGLEYKLVSPKEWHEYFDFDKNNKGLTSKEKRDKIKEQSIQFSRDNFKNVGDFLLRKGCRKEDDNIAEACILSLCID